MSSEELVEIDPVTLQQGMLSLKQSIHKAIDFLSNDFKIRNYVFLPFPIMLVPIVYFFSAVNKPSASQIRQLKKWFWQAAFTQRYKAGTTRLVGEDIAKMQKVVAGESPFDAVVPGIESDFFMSAWRINSTAAKAAICMLAQLNPITFLSGKIVDLANALSSYNSRQVHHIYPKAFLNNIGIGFHQANVIANICILTAEDNNSISDAPPSDYFPKIDNAIRVNVFTAALILSQVQDGNAQYAKFLEGRAAAMVMLAKQLMTQ